MNRFQELRTDYNLTLQSLDEELKIDRNKINRLESGQVPDGESLKKYSQYFNVTTDWLLGLVNAKSKNPNIQMISKHTGLTGKAIDRLNKMVTEKDEASQLIISAINKMLESPAAPLFWIGMYLDKSAIQGYISKGEKIPFTEPRKEDAKQIIHNDLFVYDESDHQIMIDGDIIRNAILDKIRICLENIDKLS